MNIKEIGFQKRLLICIKKENLRPKVLILDGLSKKIQMTQGNLQQFMLANNLLNKNIRN